MTTSTQRLRRWMLGAMALVASLATVSWGARLPDPGQDELHGVGDRPHPGIGDGLHVLLGRHLFEKETFGGNGRTCLTCHSRGTGTVSPEDAQERFARDPNDPLFTGDGSDDGEGNGSLRMLTRATVLVNVPLADNVRLAADANARTALVRRGVPTTLNTPALDPVLMYDGRHTNLDAQALSAIVDHGAARRKPSAKELERVAEFERTRPFFSSAELWNLALTGMPPALPAGRTASEKRGREFFEDVPLGSGNFKRGICATCHSGPMLNETNEALTIEDVLLHYKKFFAIVTDPSVDGDPAIDLTDQDQKDIIAFMRLLR